MRMCGTDASRLNVTANGVPMNNPDSHATFLVRHTPDFISAVGTVQVQRGAGTSTHGTVPSAVRAQHDDRRARHPLREATPRSPTAPYNTNKQAIHIGSGSSWAATGSWMHASRTSARTATWTAAPPT